MPVRPTKSKRPAKADSKPAKKSAPKPAMKPARKAPAKKKAARVPVEVTPNAEADAKTRARAMAIAKAALDKKAEDVVLIDVHGLTSIADFFVVMSGAGERQLDAIAESIEVALKKDGAYALSTEGQQGGNWVLLDYGDVVAHIFEAEQRAFYDLEGLWADAPRERIAG